MAAGNFGSALVRILGRNALRHDVFDNEVRMSVHEEMIDGKPLTKIINETNENVKYLKGAKFTKNVIADPNLESATKGATMICFCLPHQFLKPMMPKIKAAAAPGVKVLSAIKGIDFDENGIVLISDILRKELNADCSVLMGANVANDMASDAFCETTIGYRDQKNGELFKLAYDDFSLKVGTVQDTVGVELCGALKNIVAIGAGFVDGLGMGGNTKAAIIRIGLKEMVTEAALERSRQPVVCLPCSLHPLLSASLLAASPALCLPCSLHPLLAASPLALAVGSGAPW